MSEAREKKPVTLGDLTDELVNLTQFWNDYEDIPKSQQRLCQDIGRRLHDAGGFRYMTDAYYHAKARNRYASTIQAYWDGIGNWRW